MTRFIMSLDEAVDLLCLPLKTDNGDILVQAPACTIGVLAQAVKELFPLMTIFALSVSATAKDVRNPSDQRRVQMPLI